MMSQKKHGSGGTRGTETTVRVRIVLDESSRIFSNRLDRKSVSEATHKDSRALQQLAAVRMGKDR
jgi:hypothetical protein